MSPMKKYLACILQVVAFSLTSSAFAAEPFPTAPGRHTVQFPESAIQSGAEEVKARLSAAEDAPAYDITKERFELVVPANYRATEPWGLFIWIDAGNRPKLPPQWESVLATHKLLVVAALNSGNPRNIFDRMRMALDANVGMRRHYKIDGRRVYVSGFSGGARVASMLGVAFADLFSGTAPVMGVNFYTDLPAPDGKQFGTSYIPDDQVLAIAKQKCRYVLMTGEKDFNRANTEAAHEHGFQKEGFASVLYLEAPATGHTLPDAKFLEQALEYLDRGK